jgi:hypothetical protein
MTLVRRENLDPEVESDLPANRQPSLAKASIWDSSAQKYRPGRNTCPSLAKCGQHRFQA